MSIRRPSARLPLVVALLAGAVIVVPALAVDPSPGASTTPTASSKPDKSPKPDKAAKPEKAPNVEVTLRGTVAQTTNADGDVEYTLASGGKTYRLDAGPSWWWSDTHPLKPFVGKSVAIVGEQRQGSDEVDVQSVDGTAVRAKGRPPWAGGWKVVGPKHPGWTAEKAARHAAKGPHGRATAPGQLKDTTKEAPTPSGAPD